jgi:hypothetical protein
MKLCASSRNLDWPMLRHTLSRAAERFTAKHSCDLRGDTVCCYDQRSIQMYVALCDAARGMSK